MSLRTMTLPDLKMVLEWARGEGWNPGLDDAEAFFSADPEGFFLWEVDGQPAAAISVINHDPDHAFLGLYISRPAFRGQGHGLALWTKALAHAGTRAVSLEGVPDQQSNYAKSGFRYLGKTVRYGGTLPPLAGGAMMDASIDRLIDADETASGHRRARYATQWFRDVLTRKTVVLDDLPEQPAFATFRKCHDGIKIGPLQATSAELACALLDARPVAFEEGPFFVDIPEASAPLTRLFVDLGFQPVFETARMVRGTPPDPKPPEFFAVTSLELG